jgi:hypothetical protein
VIRAILAEPGDAAIDDARIDFPHALIIYAKFRLHVGPEVFDHDVGFFRKPPEHLEAFRILQIERHRALVAVQILKVGALARAARLLAGGVFQQGVDLDDIGAPIRELPHAGRPGADTGEIKHGEAGQRLRGTRDGHYERLRDLRLATVEQRLADCKPHRVAQRSYKRRGTGNGEISFPLNPFARNFGAAGRSARNRRILRPQLIDIGSPMILPPPYN